MITITHQMSQDVAPIETLLNNTFGPDRLLKSSSQVRLGVKPIAGLSFVARENGKLVGTIRFWPILLRDRMTGETEEHLLLGPLAISPDMQGKNLGRRLLDVGLNTAREKGFKRTFLVGALSYYSRFGFETVLPHYITMPGGADADRLLYFDLLPSSPLPDIGEILPVSAQQYDGGDLTTVYQEDMKSKSLVYDRAS